MIYYCYFDLFWRVVVAFLHFVINLSDIVVSKQQSVLFILTLNILTLSKLILVDWLRLALWSVWTFLPSPVPVYKSKFDMNNYKCCVELHHEHNRAACMVC